MRGLNPFQLEFYAGRMRAFGESLLMVMAVIALLMLMGMPAAFAQDGSLTISTTVAADGKITPTLSWSTVGNPIGVSCTATGAWTGTKQGNGTETLPAALPPLGPYNLACNGPGQNSTNLSWTAPTHNTDGTALPKCAAATDTGACLAKYKICRGSSNSTAALTDCRDHLFPNSTNANWTALAVGTHYFAIKAVNGQGAESVFSNLVNRISSPAVTWSASVGVKQPAAPTGLVAE